MTKETTVQLSIDDITAKTMDALIGAGLTHQTVWGDYSRHYLQLRKYCHDQ